MAKWNKKGNLYERVKRQDERNEKKKNYAQVIPSKQRE
jgi:hypothetical protein